MSEQQLSSLKWQIFCGVMVIGGIIFKAIQEIKNEPINWFHTGMIIFWFILLLITTFNNPK